jgi:hypothetical protein
MCLHFSDVPKANDFINLIYVHLTLFFAFMPSMCNVSSRLLFIDTTCFGLIGHLQVYRLLCLSNMLLTVITTNSATEYGQLGRNRSCKHRENNEKTATDVAHRRHKSKAQSQIHAVQQDDTIYVWY